MLVYFAQPIDQARRTFIAESQIRDLMAEAGVSAFSPSRAYTIAENPLSDLLVLDAINRAALAAADALVAWLPESIPTLGVPAEIEQAISMGKPTVIFTSRELMLKSVQVMQWQQRGAQVIPVSDIENIIKRPVVFTDALRSRPELWATIEPTPATLVGPPPLLVEYDEAATELTRAHPDDAGLDLAIMRAERLEPGERRMLPTGVRAAVPSGWWGLIIGRSSTLVKHNCRVELAVIDAGYRGELMIQVTNLSERPIHFNSGTRLAQYVLLPAFLGSVTEVDNLPDHTRGENGYGSSGV